MSKCLLLILDGWGHSPESDSSAIKEANTQFIDSLYIDYPNTLIRADGEFVGLPEGQMGNSEVGHMTIGAGKVIYQDLVRISKSIQDGSLEKDKHIIEALEYAKSHNTSVHLMGLISDGGVHSHIDHLYGLIDIVSKHNLNNVFIHGFTDGRDCDPTSGMGFIKSIQEKIVNTKVQLASIIGRFYAMDRDKRWERVEIAYNCLVNAEAEMSEDISKSIQKSYDNGVTDEFIKPIRLLNSPESKIKNNDVVIFFNFRTDRGRELTQVLSQEPNQNMTPLSLRYLTMTCYDPNFKNVVPIFNKENISDTLGELVSKMGKTQVRIAETEKYPHVTFFFNGGQETPFPNEERVICPSPKVLTYDEQPEMNAKCVTQATIEAITQHKDFICTNFANPDMVGHTGDLQAAIQACETVDQSIQQIVTTALNHNYSIIITADHGNCEVMKNPDGSINTSHTTNPVPLILINSNQSLSNTKSLADIKPLILNCLH